MVYILFYYLFLNAVVSINYLDIILILFNFGLFCLLPIIVVLLIIDFIAIDLYLIVGHLNVVLLVAWIVVGIKLLLLLLRCLHLLLLSHHFIISL